MIEREYGELSIICDECGETVGPYDENGGFDIVVREAKDAGFTFHKTKNGQWEHFCPECAKRLEYDF